MPSQKLQNMHLLIESTSRDSFGVIEVKTILNGKPYTFPITSEFALRKVQSLLRRHKPGKALQLLRLFLVEKESNTYLKES